MEILNKQSMNIVHLRDKYLAVTFIYFLLKGFRKHNHYILCREIEQEDLVQFPYDKIIKTSFLFYPFWIADKILTVKLKLSHRIINDWRSYFFKIKQIKDVKIIHAHMGQQGVYALPLMKRLKCPMVTTFYGADMSIYSKDKFWYRKYLELFNNSNGIIVEGYFMKQRMIVLGCPEEKVFISKIGIPIENIKFSTRPVLPAGGCLNIFMCATFTYKKGFFDALNVFRLLKTEDIPFRVHIVGDGILKKQILDMISEYDLANEVILLGRRSLKEIYDFGQNCHVFFHPSKFGPDGDSEGGAPTIILEMQAMGLPVISTKHADIPNIIPEGNHFLLGEEGNVTQLFDIFIRFIDNSHRWNDISATGRRFVEINHSNYICAEKLEHFYEEIYKSENRV